MSDIKKMKIMYLNVNGFAGKKTKKSEKTCYEGVAEQIGENNKTKDADMIFLSEINTQKNELKEVFLKEINTKEKDNEKYDILYPIATDETLGRASCTICLKKNGLKIIQMRAMDLI